MKANRIHFASVFKKIVLLPNLSPLLVFALALFVMVFLRISVTNLNREGKATLPETYFALPNVGWDWWIVNMKPAYALLSHSPIDLAITGYGRASAVLVSGLIPVAESLHLCPKDQTSCSTIFYRIEILLVFSGLAILALFSGKSDQGRGVAALFLVTFFLGIPGALGLDRGNIDILFAVIFGWLLFVLLSDRIGKTFPVRWSLLTGILFGILANTKIFLLPLGLFAVLASPSFLLAGISFFLSFVGFSYIPAFFGAKPTPFDPYLAAVGAQDNFWKDSRLIHTPGNTVFSAQATALLDILRTSSHLSNGTLGLISAIIVAALFAVVFILPFWLEKARIRTVFTAVKKSGKAVLVWIGKETKNPYCLFFLSVVTIAGFTLLPFMSYDYRLYYTAVVFVVGLVLPKTQKQQAIYFWAMLFFLGKNMWIEKDRLMNLFLLPCYFLLLKVSLDMWLSSWLKPQKIAHT